MSAAVWAVPVYLAAFGALLWCGAKWTSRRFDRKHPRLSRKGMRDSVNRERAEGGP